MTTMTGQVLSGQQIKTNVTVYEVQPIEGRKQVLSGVIKTVSGKRIEVEAIEANNPSGYIWTRKTRKPGRL